MREEEVILKTLDFIIKSILDKHLSSEVSHTIRLMNGKVDITINNFPSGECLIELLHDICGLLEFFEDNGFIKSYIIKVTGEHRELEVKSHGEKYIVKARIEDSVYTIVLPSSLRNEQVEVLKSFIIKAMTICVVRLLETYLIEGTICGLPREVKVGFNVEKGEPSPHGVINVDEVPFYFWIFLEISLEVAKERMKDIRTMANTLSSILYYITSDLYRALSFRAYTIEELLSKSFLASVRDFIERLKRGYITFDYD